MRNFFKDYYKELINENIKSVINDKSKENLNPKQMARLYELTEWAKKYVETEKEDLKNCFTYLLNECKDFNDYVNKNYINYKTAIKKMNKLQETENLKNKDLKELKKIYMSILESEPSDYLNLNYERCTICDICEDFNDELCTLIRKI